MSSNHLDSEKPAVNEKRQQTFSLLGAHFSIAGGLHQALYKAVSYRCNTLQIFTKNANTWKERYLSQSDIDRFEKAKSETGLTQIASHTSYLINLATDEKKKHFLSYNALKQELIRSATLGIPYVVLHPGFPWEVVKFPVFGESLITSTRYSLKFHIQIQGYFLKPLRVKVPAWDIPLNKSDQ